MTAAPLKLLILGGTGFLGPETIEPALAKGAEVTVFNRGKSNPELVGKKGWKIEEIRGDRDPKEGEGLKALEEAVKSGRTWDAVIDNSAYVPRIARASAELLKSATRQYIFVSTISVYPDISGDIDEDSPVGAMSDPTDEKVGGATYGPLKALCEQAVRDVFADRATIVRPGLLVGPGDPTDRFTYWPVRIARGLKVILPVPKDQWKSYMQWIDVRDLGDWMVRLAADGHAGTYNALGPDGTMTLNEFLFGIRATTSARVEWIPIDEKFLLEQQVTPWMGLPLWIPQEDGGVGGTRMKNARAISVGLTFRPLANTAHDTAEWFAKYRPADFDFGQLGKRGPGAGLSREKEAAVIAAWAARPVPAP
ncbi:MAG: NAD-dependent epimerase/dehydratase family protein [Phycisphaerae bacterium]|mgnify:CR=1 FL=1|nr:NAD-dependent epimerase/dehydratase family protein [Phycisphaerae bacterium]